MLWTGFAKFPGLNGRAPDFSPGLNVLLSLFNFFSPESFRIDAELLLVEVLDVTDCFWFGSSAFLFNKCFDSLTFEIEEFSFLSFLSESYPSITAWSS